MEITGPDAHLEVQEQDTDSSMALPARQPQTRTNVLPPGDRRPHPAIDRGIGGACRRYAGPGASGEADSLLCALRSLQQALESWSAARLTAAAGSAASVPPSARMPLGLFVRRFVLWLEDHPETADAPLHCLDAWLSDWAAELDPSSAAASATSRGEPAPDPSGARSRLSK